MPQPTSSTDEQQPIRKLVNPRTDCGLDAKALLARQEEYLAALRAELRELVRERLAEKGAA